MRKILVIDDEPSVRHTIRRLLECGGYATIEATDGDSGVTVFRNEKPDLVITDIIMPEREGIETIRDILAAQPDAKIIAISGGSRRGTADYLEIARKLGAIAVLSKPFDPEELLELISKNLA